MKSKPLIKHLDSPIRFLTLSLHDFITYMTPFFLGAIFDSLIILPFFGLAVIYFFKRAIKPLPKFYLVRYLYWSIPTIHYNKALKVQLPPSSKRLWVK